MKDFYLSPFPPVKVKALFQEEKEEKRSEARLLIEKEIKGQKKAKKGLMVVTALFLSIEISGAVAIQYTGSFLDGVLVTLMVLSFFLIFVFIVFCDVLRASRWHLNYLRSELAKLEQCPEKINIFHLRKDESGKYYCTQEHVDFVIKAIFEVTGGLSEAQTEFYHKAIPAFYNYLNREEIYSKLSVNFRRFCDFINVFIAATDTSYELVRKLFRSQNEIENYIPDAVRLEETMYQATIIWQGDPSWLVETPLRPYRTKEEALQRANGGGMKLRLIDDKLVLFYMGREYKVLKDDEVMLKKIKPEFYKKEACSEDDYTNVSIPVNEWKITEGLNSGFESLAYSIFTIPQRKEKD